MENDFSAIRSIQELKNLLDSGAITPQEYEALKRKIIFGPGGAEGAVAQPAMPGNPRTPVTENPNPVTVPREPVVPPSFSNERYGQPEPVQPAASFRNTVPIEPPVVNEEIYVEENKKKDWLLTILITLGVLLLLGLIGYNLLSDSDSERLTSTSGPEKEEVIADTVTATNDITTSTRPDRIEPAGDTVAAIPPVVAATPATEEAPATTDQTAAATQPSAPVLSEAEIMSRINDRLASYYDDMKASPFSAQRHFASSVERYYTLINTNPTAINENINTYHFTEFQDSESSIEEGSMKLTANNADGFEVTYLEHGSALRKSKGQKQETTARVRARFDPNFKMTYFRQEALLENKFVE